MGRRDACPTELAREAQFGRRDACPTARRQRILALSGNGLRRAWPARVGRGCRAVAGIDCLVAGGGAARALKTQGLAAAPATAQGLLPERRGTGPHRTHHAGNRGAVTRGRRRRYGRCAHTGAELCGEPSARRTKPELCAAFSRGNAGVHHTSGGIAAGRRGAASRTRQGRGTGARGSSWNPSPIPGQTSQPEASASAGERNPGGAGLRGNDRGRHAGSATRG